MFLLPGRPILVCLLAGFLGVCLLPLGLRVEEDLGLGFLFKLRGTRAVPGNVVIVSTDKVSSDNLDLPEEPDKWPRSLHARLTTILANAGASVIVFDLLFDQPSIPANDELFAQAMRSTNNVILCEWIKRETLSVFVRSKKRRRELDIEKIIPPISPFAEAAAALAPFALPKVPKKVAKYWTFKSSAGDIPTLPVVAFQFYALPAYGEFLTLLRKISPSEAKRLPQSREEILASNGVLQLILTARDIFRQNPGIGKSFLNELDEGATLSTATGNTHLLRSLIDIYQGEDSRYLNFYGPPRTIKTIPYYKLLQCPYLGTAQTKNGSFAGKAVFIGLSETMHPELRDSFHTVFTGEDGIDLSGVEIAATGFANLLEGRPLKPLSLRVCLGLVFAWGLLSAILCFCFSFSVAAATIIGLGILYLALASYQFNQNGIWFPLVIPLLIQAPVTLYVNGLCRYLDSKRDRERVRKAFGYYLPAKVIDGLARNIGEMKSNGEVVYGTCLSTDAEQYTGLSETMGPQELRNYLNQYYEVVFNPVKRHGGFVSDVVGDSMLALWASAELDANIRHKACLAAMDILNATFHFNQSYFPLKLPTRIGVHAGEIVIGNVGAGDHFEYRPVGDIVNTVSRIERLNKYLGTWILMSDEVLDGTEVFLTREMGTFLLSGKSKPLVIHELMGWKESATAHQKDLCAMFSQGLEAFKKQSWDDACRIFRECEHLTGEDYPSKFYGELCCKYKENPPGEVWNGLVCLDYK